MRISAHHFKIVDKEKGHPESLVLKYNSWEITENIEVRKVNISASCAEKHDLVLFAYVEIFCHVCVGFYD